MPSAAFTVTAMPNVTLNVSIYVDAGTALEMRHDGKIVTGNPSDDTTNTAVVRRYSIPPQDELVRRCPGAVVVMEGSDLRGKTPEPGPPGPTLRARRGLILRPEHQVKRASSWAIRLEVH
ncbi:hypothetical protein HDU87_002337 [Geranomyces variabilis]|uniref:Uncharacterized protein n=1 Tax=Geranomyces variabilis TaxID=109894 RepID=A0AAD5XN43_9FUNG|nr:hypothetical protein HDU87_002337 [Geranomyces variabilis]